MKRDSRCDGCDERLRCCASEGTACNCDYPCVANVPDSQEAAVRPDCGGKNPDKSLSSQNRREPHGVGVPSSLNVPRLMVPQMSRRIDGGWHEREKITSELQLSRVEEGKRGLNGVKGQNALTPQKGVCAIFIRYLDPARCRSWRHGVVANFTASRHRE